MIANEIQIQKIIRLFVNLTLLFPLFYWAYIVFIEPRPFWLISSDLSHDYYYNAKLLYNGITNLDAHHPGTPIYYLSYLLMLIIGSGPESTELFFNAGYFLSSLLMTISLFIFWNKIAKNLHPVVGYLSIVSIISWPGIWTFQNNFGSDSFLISTGLIVLTIYYLFITKKNELSFYKIYFLGISIGFCLSIKLSFLPIAFALIISSLTISSPYERLDKPNIKYFIAMLFSVFFSFLIFCAPVLKILIKSIFASLTSAISAQTRNVHILNAIMNFIKLSPGFSLIYFLVTGIFIYIFFKYLYATKKIYVIINFVLYQPMWIFITIILIALFPLLLNHESNNPIYFGLYSDKMMKVIFLYIFLVLLVIIIAVFSKKIISFLKIENNIDIDLISKDKLEYFPLGIFLFIVAFTFLFLLVGVPVWKFRYPGHELHRIAPLGLFFPFAIIYIYHIAESFVVPFKNYFSKQKIIITYLFFFALVFNLVFHIYQRSEFIEYWSSKHKITKKKLLAITEGKGTIIFWDGSPGFLVGEESFHFWGNYRYGNEMFYDELSNSFPKFRWLRFRHIEGAKHSRSHARNNDIIKYGLFNNELFFKKGVEPKNPLLFAIRKSEFRLKLSVLDFIDGFIRPNKSIDYWEELIANDLWIFILSR